MRFTSACARPSASTSKPYRYDRSRTMKAESVIFTVSGVVFGLVVGWMLGVQQAERVTQTPAVTAQAGPAAPGQGGAAPGSGGTSGSGGATAAPLDTARVQALEARAQASPDDAAVRAELGNLYFDAERFADAARWYEASLAIAPGNADVRTDLGICYYYMNQAPRAIEQFEVSLKTNPR